MQNNSLASFADNALRVSVSGYYGNYGTSQSIAQCSYCGQYVYYGFTHTCAYNNYTQQIQFNSQGAIILSEPKPMNKLSLVAKQLLDSDLRTLVKADILDDSLNVKDKDFVLSFIVIHYKKELALEAKKLLKERKTEKGED